ncbi:MAG TPA: baseplate J/gp47 family protein [Gaiellaceae bacterium]|nr:baseplate J/gp47 family protein [Gaiellaceae bacterium]
MTSTVSAPVVDNRSFQDLVDEAKARIPIHNPEWTNFNRSDPGITLLELYAFMTESVLYRVNQIPERNRRVFLSLLGVPLQPASSAKGIVTFSNESGKQQTITLNSDLEVRAGQVPFRTELGVDVLPVEAQIFYKRAVPTQPDLVGYYDALYASYTADNPDATTLQLYETVPLAAPASQQGQTGVNLSETVDRSLWVALLLRRADGPGSDDARNAARTALANKTLSLGFVPVQDDPDALLSPLGRSANDTKSRLDYSLPRVAATGSLGPDGSRTAMYRSLDPNATVNVLDEPGIVQLTLPDASGLGMWEDIDPLEAGVGDLPPALEDTKLAARVVTWLRIQATPGAQAELLWAGINAVTVTQQTRVVAEVLPPGTGTPDQAIRLAHSPVLPETLNLRIGDPPETWTRIDDLYTAGPEVPVPDLRSAPGAPQPPPSDPKVFTVDAASSIVRFGDGLHGMRPPNGAPMRADYAYGNGAGGNVGPGSISTAAALPAGVKVTNPIRTWGGAAAETVDEGEKQIARYLQHRDRLVSAEDFEAIVPRTPGVDVGRLDVVPAFNPELSPSAPGDAAGAVTLMLIPRVDALHPDAPQPDQAFLDAVCDYIDPRRLVTTEVFLRGPTYKQIWLSVGFDPIAGQSIATVRDAIKAELLAFLAPLPTPGGDFPHAGTGWPRLKPVVPLELLAVASRVPGVDLVRPVLVAAGDAAGSDSDPIPMNALELPLVTISVTAGDPLPLDQVRGLSPAQAQPSTVVPVPIVPDTC